ncbi:transmembrane protein 234 homolog isoform X1 [Rhodnius prolixus]
MDYKLNFLLVGAFWGITNPFLKRSLKGMDEVKKNSHINQLFADLYFLIFNWKYLIPFLIANCGSVIYYFTLQKTDLTVAVPFSNSLAFLFTAVTGWMLGEQKPNAATVLGMTLILAGNCCYDL